MSNATSIPKTTCRVMPQKLPLPTTRSFSTPHSHRVAHTREEGRGVGRTGDPEGRRTRRPPVPAGALGWKASPGRGVAGVGGGRAMRWWWWWWWWWRWRRRRRRRRRKRGCEAVDRVSRRRGACKVLRKGGARSPGAARKESKESDIIIYARELPQPLAPRPHRPLSDRPNSCRKAVPRVRTRAPAVFRRRTRDVPIPRSSCPAADVLD
jgi:hypothetical protein